MSNLIIRQEVPADFDICEKIVRDAFWDKFKPGCDEHAVLHRMRSHEDYLSQISFVAEYDGELIGGIWFSEANVTSADGKSTKILTFGPVAITPALQGKGYGAELIRHAIQAARELAYPGIVIYGDPGYYSRFGFQPAEQHGIFDGEGNPCPALQVLPFTDNLPGGNFHESGVYFVPQDELREFERQFPHRQKHLRSTQLFWVFPSPPPEEPLLKQSHLMREAACALLRNNHVIECWESIGARIRLVGSVRTGLICRHRDVDLHIYTDQLDAAQTLAALSPLLAQPNVLQCTFINGAQTDEECLEWHLKILDNQQQTWDIDMIQIRSGSRYDGKMEDTAEAIIDHMTPEEQHLILELKEHQLEGYVCGIQYVKAVLDDGVRTIAEFEEWRRHNPPETLLGWMPGAK